MKKVFLIAVLVCFFFTDAQIEFRPGVRGGLNLADFTNTNGAGSKTDFYIGAFGVVKFVHFYNLQPEIIYSRQGTDFDLGGDPEISYISIVIANKFFPFKGLGLHAIIGPSFDIKVDDNFESINTIEPEGFDFALFGGLGYEFPFGLSIEARYKQGFVDIFGENINNTVAFDELIVNKVIQIGATYQFDFK